MIKRLSIIIGILLMAGVIIIFKVNFHEIKRNSYKNFIKSHYATVASLIKNENDAEVRNDHPEFAAFQDYLMTVDPNEKRVPRERLFEIYKNRNQKQYKSVSALTERYPWTEIKSNMGGRVRAFMFDPNDAGNKKVWAGAVTGGLWYNLDITNTASPWKPVSDLWENMTISSITYDPNNTSIFYAGTGEAQTAVTIYRESSGKGVGIWKSTDGGTTWELLPSTSGFAYVTDIIVRNEDGQSVIYAGVVSGTYKGKDHLSTPSDGLYRSTDGGNTWEQVLPDVQGYSMPYATSDIELSATNRIFVGTYRNIDGVGGGTILYSDNGFDWTVFADYSDSILASPEPTINIPGRTILASSVSAPNTIYAIISAGGYTSTNFIYYKGRYLLKSNNEGVTWEKKNLPYGDNDWATLAWHALTIKVDPLNENVIFAGGLDQHRSRDGGETWQELSAWYNYGIYSHPDYLPYVHADQHQVAFKPGTSDTIYFCTDGGVFATFNGTDEEIDFTEMNNSFNSLQFYTCAMSPQAHKMFFTGGLQDNGTLLYNNKPFDVNDFVSGGDGAFCFFDDDDLKYYISSVYYNRYYIFNTDSNYFDPVHYIYDFAGSGIFINPADYDSRNNILYCNAMTLEGTMQDSLLCIENVLDMGYTGRYIGLNTGSEVAFSAITVSKYTQQDEVIILVGNQIGELFKIENILESPVVTEIGSSLFPPGNISCITEGSNADELFVTFSNYGVSSLWYTEDGGTTWIEKESNLHDIPVRWAVFDPSDNNKLLLATEMGVWATQNIHATPVNWEPVVKGMANVRVDMLKTRKADNMILAATHGRGMYYCKINTDIGTGIDEHEYSFDIFPNPSDGIIYIKNNEMISEDILVEIYDMAGRKVFDERIDYNWIPFRISQLNISDLQSGTYIINIKFRDGKYAQKIILSE